MMKDSARPDMAIIDEPEMLPPVVRDRLGNNAFSKNDLWRSNIRSHTVPRQIEQPRERRFHCTQNATPASALHKKRVTVLTSPVVMN